MSAEDWKDFFSLCQYHQILPMIYDTVYGCPAFVTFPQQEVQAVKGQVIRQVMIQSRKTEEFLILYKELLRAGLTPVVVKGIICRNMYREPDYRCSGDEDVLIPKEQFGKCHDIFLANSMKPLNPDKDPEAEGEVPYYKDRGALHIELHKELFASESEAYGDLNELFAGVFDRMIQEEIGGVKIYTMSHTDHLFYLILHAFKHFLHSGFGSCIADSASGRCAISCFTLSRTVRTLTGNTFWKNAAVSMQMYSPHRCLISAGKS